MQIKYVIKDQANTLDCYTGQCLARRLTAFGLTPKEVMECIHRLRVGLVKQMESGCFQFETVTRVCNVQIVFS